MRTSLLLIVAFSFSLSGLIAGEATRAAFVDARISAKEICLNEAVRVEFTTNPRDIPNVDVVQSITYSLQLSAAKSWRLMGEPQLTEALRATPRVADPLKAVKEPLKPIRVVFYLLPRVTGDLTIPDLPITWLQGNFVAHFNPVTVVPNILIAGKRVEIPQAANGVGGFAWTSTLDEVRTRVSADKMKVDGTRTVITPKPQLTLTYSNGFLGEATLRAPALTLDVARSEFSQRWGIPQQEDTNSLTWFIGWTRITARPDPQGITLSLVREDIQAKLANAQVKADIFDVLESPKETIIESTERKEREIQAEINRPVVPGK